jgi:carbamoyltransferase
MRDHLNRVVKNRESVRPFAPVVLEDAVLDYFEERHPSTYMSFVSKVRAEKRSIVPAITHVDASARYQVLRKPDNPELHELITAFAKRTGVPLLLNTSLNRAGEPIVETPLEAARCMLAASADYLVLDGAIYGRSG